MDTVGDLGPLNFAAILPFGYLGHLGALGLLACLLACLLVEGLSRDKAPFGAGLSYPES